jgi:hypothetical protein
MILLAATVDACPRRAKMVAWNGGSFDPRRLPLVEVPQIKIRHIDFDGLDEGVQIVGKRFQVLLWKLVQPFSFDEPVRAPVALISRPLSGYVPGYFDALVLEAMRRHEVRAPLGQIPAH